MDSPPVSGFRRRRARVNAECLAS